ncbi:hypothetical protein DFJ67_2150 [Asanoa ferruginea]|uniref:Phage resistance protein n=1 Tax=Asanoa ferruginea TaxID=53367 RepID=A0A3D9ZR79_9ACTN|nr:phage resistance protein [Asanoa ferruginea]REF96180.1 hypothetical protein DFJ67_2150 [Asanoa ferruginea]GIF49324.1 hypothetical protein Afe04nite_38630 [Asanoa ferruginea]
MTLLRELIEIPTSVGDADFVVRASEGADLRRYVVTDDLRRNFDEALSMVGHAVTSGRSQAKFLHGSFGSGKSHFMAVLREILAHNAEARSVRSLGEPVAKADEWLHGKRVLSLTFHMLDARSTEQAILEGYLRQITALHPEAPPPAVHLSDGLLRDAAKLRADLGDEKFFDRLRGTGMTPGGSGSGLAVLRAQSAGWTADSYERAAASAPGTKERDALVSALMSTFFTGAVRGGEYLDLDTGLAVITRHAKDLNYDAMVFFLDELILWLSTKIADHTFVQTEGAKLNKLVESSDTARPLPIASFIARQRNLEDFLGPQVGGTERAALADVMRSVQGRLGQDIVLADTNLPEITEKRLLKPNDGNAKAIIDQAFSAVRGRREVWDVLLLGDQYGDAGIGSDAASFRRLYPFSPALVATLVALSQALQRERTALKVMTELLVERRNTLAVNDLIGVAALFEPLVLRGELPDRPELKQLFQAGRDTYLHKFRPLLLATHGIGEAEAPHHELFALDDRLVKTLILGALVAEVPALHNLTAAKLHALNFGSIATPIPGYENQIVLDRLRRLAADAGQLHIGEGPDPVISVTLASVDYDRLLDLVPHNETASGVLQQLVRELVSGELGLELRDGTFGELPYAREWRGRKHPIQVRFGNVRDKDSMPDSALIGHGDAWRIVVDYPFDPGHRRNEDFARIETLERGHRTVLWMPLFLTDDVMGRVAQLAKINYLLGGGNGDRLTQLAADWSVADRQQGKVYLQQRQQQLRVAITDAFKQAYGAAAPHPANVESDAVPILHTLAHGLRLGDPRGGTLRDAFQNLTGTLLAWSYPGIPALPDDEKSITRAELAKVLKYARLAAAEPTKGIAVDTADQRTIRRICNQLRLGELHEHRYVLTMSTCWWSGHLLQEASKQGYKEHFPIHVLRPLLDQEKPRGFERDLQNAILAVFAEEQQLAWFHHGSKVPVDSVQAVDDAMELRQIPLPDEQTWSEARTRTQGLFGKQPPAWRSAGNLGVFASMVRAEARAQAASADVLARELERNADALGLDVDATTGRLATARRVARLLKELSGESDDVDLIARVARADVGDVDDAVAGRAFKSAGAVIDALAGAQWPLIHVIRTLTPSDTGAAEIVERLEMAARHEQNAKDLVEALRNAGNAAARHIAQIDPEQEERRRKEKEEREKRDRELKEKEERERRDRERANARMEIFDGTGLDELTNRLSREVESGKTVTVWWEVR